MGELVPDEVKELLVLEFGNLVNEFPPSFVVHGNADTLVPFHDGEKFVKQARALGLSTKFWGLEGYEHDFGGSGGYGDLEGEEYRDSKDIGHVALKELLKEGDEVL